MKIKLYASMLLMIGVISSLPLQAATVNTTHTVNIQTITTQDLYIDASALNLPFKQIPGNFISPLQVAGELLAPFSQVRTGYTHEGIDIRAAEGTPVFAIADGVVTKAAPDSKGVNQGGGHMIFVDFGSGIEGRYMHLSGYGVKAGDKVRAGQVIGFTGNTGDSSTPHLHFEYRVGGVLMDPAFIFEASGMITTQEISKQTSGLIGLFNEPFFVIQQ